jgi:hypothetical protein
MTSILEFECRVPVDGYRVIYFDEGKFDFEEINWNDKSVRPPANATEDELCLLRRWGGSLVPMITPDHIAMGIEPEVREIFEPQSEKFRSFNLFDVVSAPYEDFVNTPALIGDVEGPKALADRFGPLHGEHSIPYVEDWFFAIDNMHRALKAWKKADATGDFRPVIRGFSHKGPKPGRNRIDASISLREDSASGAARFCIRPETLLDALWTQLAHAIDGSQSLKNCVVCKNLFTIKSGQGRSDKEYCSDACRMRAYRKRKGC